MEVTDSDISDHGQPPTLPLFKCGTVIVDTARREMTIDGDSIAIEQRAFDLLAYLMARISVELYQARSRRRKMSTVAAGHVTSLLSALLSL